MKSKTMLAVLLTALATLFVVAAPSAQGPTPTPTATPTPAAPAKPPKPKLYWQKNGCERKVTKPGYRWRLRTEFTYSIRDGHFNVQPVSKKAHARLHAARECAASKKARRLMLRAHKQHRKQYAWVARIDAITVHGDYAVPTAVISCEGGVGGWNVMNHGGSGAAGPYQLLGWGAPMPAEGNPARQARHHEIAYRVSSGGTNLGPWVSSKGCWG